LVAVAPRSDFSSTTHRYDVFQRVTATAEPRSF
jgi:hypothetical protein